jgi:hypothetical protein
VVVFFVVALTVDNENLNAMNSNLHLSLPFSILHDVAIPMTGVIGEANHLNFKVLGLFMSTPEHVIEEYELHS